MSFRHARPSQVGNAKPATYVAPPTIMPASVISRPADHQLLSVTSDSAPTPMADEASFPFERLDFLYMPSGDVPADAEHFTSVPGARLVFAIEAFGTRVAMVRLSDEPPDLLLAEHLAGDRPILVYRVADLDRATEQLAARGWDTEPRFGIPHGPCCSFRTPGGHRLAIYELTRPQATERLAGRRDF
jgi:hypothetical protein